MKIVRLGMTESGLLLLTFASKNLNLEPAIKQQIGKYIMSLVNWLYTTSGYYDKTVIGTKFNFTHSALNLNFSRYMGHLKEAVNNCKETQFYFHDGFIRQLFEKYKEEFITHFNVTNFNLLNDTKFSPRIPKIYDEIRGKKVLVISSFDKIIESQYNSGNVYKLGLGFPEISGIQTYKFPYCFLNNGPHNNYFETLDDVFKSIMKMDFDIALLGCGSYGHMLTHMIHANLNKEAIYIGGCITNLFGILSTREREATDLTINEFWITHIPDEYKPDNYKAIENGCYW
jgi:hypothetical protein